jgi:5'-3' exonuclease
VKYLLIDGNNIAMRAVFAAQGPAQLSSREGVPTGVVMIFANMVTKVIAEEQPTHIGVAWDGKSDFRRRLHAGYKANRKPSPDFAKDEAFRVLWDFLANAGIHQQYLADEEADDILAAWWDKIGDFVPREEEDSSEIVIFTGDKDMFQLVGRNPSGVSTRVRLPGGGQAPAEYMDEARLLAEKGCSPGQWAILLALQGDTSDGIDGIPGVGPKKALKLMQDFEWDWSRAVKERYPDHAATVRRNMQLIVLRNALRLDIATPPVTALPTYEEGAPDAFPDKLDTFFERYDLASLQTRYRLGQLWTKPKQAGRPFRARPAAERGTP